MQSERELILQEAINLTTGDRNASYGDPKDNLNLIGDLVSTYFGQDSIRMGAHAVAIIMCFVKLSRIRNNNSHRDSYVDLAAYAAIAYEVLDKEKVDA